MQNTLYIPVVLGALIVSSFNVKGDGPSAFGSGFDVQEFYQPFMLNEIKPENQQKWPYYKHVSANWDHYALYGVEDIPPARKPAKLLVAPKEESFDLNSEYDDGKSFLESMQATQVKGFVVMKGNRILAEFYDNGFNVDDSNLLQSASKTFAAIILHQLIDDGKLKLTDKVEDVLPEFKGSSVGKATVQQVLDHTSGMPQLLDYHTPGALGYLFELEIGLKEGKTKGHRKIIAETKADKKPGEAWQYSDMNTDTLGLMAEAASGRKIPQLLTDLFEAIGANHGGSIARTSDGTSSPCYGISMSARDFALFHQWIAEGKAPKSFYESATDLKKSLYSKNDLAAVAHPETEYGSQAYYIAENDVLFSNGSFGQTGYSDLRTGLAVIFLSDWAVNAEIEKQAHNRRRALAIMNAYIASQLSNSGI